MKILNPIALSFCAVLFLKTHTRTYEEREKERIVSHYIAQADLELELDVCSRWSRIYHLPLALASSVLRLQACTKYFLFHLIFLQKSKQKRLIIF